MRRQVGANTVKIDTRKGWVSYQLFDTRILDFSVIDEAIQGAGYTVANLHINLEAVLDEGAQALRIQSTGQKFELGMEGELLDVDGVALVPGASAHVTGEVTNWTQGKPLLTLGPPPSLEDRPLVSAGGASSDS